MKVAHVLLPWDNPMGTTRTKRAWTVATPCGEGLWGGGAEVQLLISPSADGSVPITQKPVAYTVHKATPSLSLPLSLPSFFALFPIPPHSLSFRVIFPPPLLSDPMLINLKHDFSFHFISQSEQTTLGHDTIKTIF